jgi:hypothetical protein
MAAVVGFGCCACEFYCVQKFYRRRKKFSVTYFFLFLAEIMIFASTSLISTLIV